jgi:hypothetical protein
VASIVDAAVLWIFQGTPFGLMLSACFIEEVVVDSVVNREPGGPEQRPLIRCRWTSDSLLNCLLHIVHRKSFRGWFVLRRCLWLDRCLMYARSTLKGRSDSRSQMVQNRQGSGFDVSVAMVICSGWDVQATYRRWTGRKNRCGHARYNAVPARRTQPPHGGQV